LAKKSPSKLSVQPRYVINPAQLGGIDLVSQLNGPGVGTRSAFVNTASGLHYKVMIDRGLDIGEAFYKGMSLTWLSLAGVPKPETALNRGVDWLWGFPGGLLVSCGPSSAGPPCVDNDQLLPLHGRHSNIPTTLESVISPDPFRGVQTMSITGIVREAKIFNPNFELRRTISSPLGQSRIAIDDTITNRGNQTAEHAWLLHINFGYPLVEPGTQLVFAGKVTPKPSAEQYFQKRNFRVVPEPLAEHRGGGEAVAYIDPETDHAGRVHCGLINPLRKIGIEVTFYKKQFPRWMNWQHWGPDGQFVTGFEPANCGAEGRDVDRNRGWLVKLRPRQSKRYQTEIRVLEGTTELAEFKKRAGT